MTYENWNSRRADKGSEIPAFEPDRFPIVLQTQLFPDNSDPVDIVLRDISVRGFMGECTAFVSIGSIVGVELPELGIVKATVVWALSGRLGGRFLEPIEVDRLAEQFRA
jgi:hypothetical protein